MGVRDMIDRIAAAWAWAGLAPAEVVGENAFGNLIVRDKGECYWRISPEELSCEIVAQARAELDALSRDQAFLDDWTMRRLVEEAERTIGQLGPGQKYCLKIPAVLGGPYAGSNIGIIDFAELIDAAGSLARQIAQLPDGAKVQLEITD